MPSRLSALEIVILDHFRYCLVWGVRHLQRALQLNSELTPEEREYFLGFREDIQARLAAWGAPAPDNSLVPVICLVGAVAGLKEGDPSPEDPVAAFRAVKGGIRSICNFLPNKGAVASLHLCSLLPDVYLGAVRAGAEEYGVEAALPPRDATQTERLMYLVDVCAALPRDDGESVRRAYRELTQEEAGILVDLLIGMHKIGLAQSYNFGWTVLKIAGSSPASLAPHLERLAESGLTYPPEIYKDAGTAARDKLISTRTSAVYWVGDDVVRRLYLEEVKRGELELSGARTYGWELLPDGERRDLYSVSCFGLRRAADAPGDGGTPVQVVTDHESECLSCGRKLINLFDFDLRDPRLAFLACGEDGNIVQGANRLRIAACEQCIHFSEHEEELRTYTRVTLQGGSKIDTDFPRKRAQAKPDDDFELPRRRLVLGEGPLCTLAGVASATGSSGSFVGGLPKWDQRAHYPDCPLCSRAMSFVAQANESDLGAADGTHYAFICRRCWIAVAFKQDT